MSTVYMTNKGTFIKLRGENHKQSCDNDHRMLTLLHIDMKCKHDPGCCVANTGVLSLI